MSVSKKKITTQEAIWPTPNDERLGAHQGFWLQLALALLATYSLYAAIRRFSAVDYTSVSINPFILLDPGTSSLLIVLFSAFYFFASVKKMKMSKFVKVCAYIIITIALVALVLTFIAGSKNTSSSNDFYFVFFIIFHNFLVSGVISAVSLFGTAGLLVQIVSLRKQRRK